MADQMQKELARGQSAYAFTLSMTHHFGCSRASLSSIHGMSLSQACSAYASTCVYMIYIISCKWFPEDSSLQQPPVNVPPCKTSQMTEQGQ